MHSSERQRRKKKSDPKKSRETIRPDKVARGRQLVADPNYPGPEVTRAVAEMLAHEIAPNRSETPRPPSQLPILKIVR